MNIKTLQNKLKEIYIAFSNKQFNDVSILQFQSKINCFKFKINGLDVRNVCYFFSIKNSTIKLGIYCIGFEYFKYPILKEIIDKTIDFTIESDEINSKDVIIYNESLQDKSLLNIEDIFTKINKLFTEVLKNIYTPKQTNINFNTLNEIVFKNITLYGSPGVGKTFNHKKLIAMIESNKFTQNEIFEAIQNSVDVEVDIDMNIDYIFDSIKRENRYKFLTFHQSFSYEDFIEGFRPNADGQIELQDGIFKSICKEAQENLDNSKKNEDELKQEANFEELIERFNEDILDELSNGKEYILENQVTIKGINNQGSYLLGGSITSPQRLTINMLKRDYENYKNEKIKSYKDIEPSQDSNGSWHGNAIYYLKLYKKLQEFENNLNQNSQNINNKKDNKLKNYYLVIDEINRGNISKIFGELITLIEEDKRDDYEVILPYSKEPFKIPSNLYIIATMNSTDKSIALLDIALRRRFVFIKMQPEADLITNDKAKELLKALNEKIEEHLGKDYLIGHSYFMNLDSDEDLNLIIEYKIKPLIEEYFYGDNTKIEELNELIKNTLQNNQLV